jgi:hypothetical protein
MIHAWLIEKFECTNTSTETTAEFSMPGVHLEKCFR